MNSQSVTTIFDLVSCSAKWAADEICTVLDILTPRFVIVWGLRAGKVCLRSSELPVNVIREVAALRLLPSGRRDVREAYVEELLDLE